VRSPDIPRIVVEPDDDGCRPVVPRRLHSAYRHEEWAGTEVRERTRSWSVTTETPPDEVVPRPEERSGPKHLTPRRAVGRRVTLGIAAAVILTASGLAIAESTMVRRQLALSFTRQPDDFVELYFPSPDRLPSSFLPGRPFAISFGLTDVSGTSHLFRFAVRVGLRNGRTVTERTGEVRLAPTGTRLIAVRVVLPAEATTLAVDLTGRSEEIRLHLSAAVD